MSNDKKIFRHLSFGLRHSFLISHSAFDIYLFYQPFRREIVMHIPVTTTFNIEGYKIVEYKGVIRGIIVRAPTIAQGIVGGLKSIIGGRIGAYTEMCEQTRLQAYELMIQHAQEVGANAVVGLRYDASEVASKASATEVLCYGTAVVIEPIA
jgi:uncharacterized protein YbjQ (UPF0145 family)